MLFNKQLNSLSPNKIIVIDSGHERAHLRILPSLLYLGFEHFTHPLSWRQYHRREISFYEKWFKSNYLRWKILGEKLPQRLVCCTSYYYEKAHPEYSVLKLVNKYRSITQRKNHPKLVLSFDNLNAELYGRPRPLKEEPFVKVISFSGIYQEIQNEMRERDIRFFVRDTKNLLLQEIALLIKLIEGKRITQTQKLLKHVSEAPYHPLWELAYDICWDGYQYSPPIGEEAKKSLIWYLLHHIEESKIVYEFVPYFIELVRNNEGFVTNPSTRENEFKKLFDTQSIVNRINEIKEMHIRTQFIKFLEGILQ